MKPILLCFFSLFFLFRTITSHAQRGATCDSAWDMHVSDTLFPYGASLDSGWVWENRLGPWFKFTVPAGKGIEGFMIDMPAGVSCSTYAVPASETQAVF